MFLLILLERILCLQRREDSGFFVVVLGAFLGFQALFMAQRILSWLSFWPTDVERTHLKSVYLP